MVLERPICLTKMRMSRKEWNKLQDKTRYHTEEDIKIDEERRKKVWDDAEKRRREIEAGTYVKPKSQKKLSSKTNEIFFFNKFK